MPYDYMYKSIIRFLIYTVEAKTIALAEITMRNAKTKEKACSLSDGRGLILDIIPDGNKYWIARLRIDGKEKRKSLGTYPDIGLKAARDLNYEIRKEINDGSSNEYPFDSAPRKRGMTNMAEPNQKMKRRGKILITSNSNWITGRKKNSQGLKYAHLLNNCLRNINTRLKVGKGHLI